MNVSGQRILSCFLITENIRLEQLPISNEEKLKEIELIKTTAENNGYDARKIIMRRYDKQKTNSNANTSELDRMGSGQRK
jgi:hypothetical protein